MCSVSMLPTMNPPPWIITTPGTGAPAAAFGRYTRTLTSGSPVPPRDHPVVDVERVGLREVAGHRHDHGLEAGPRGRPGR